jgi:acyl-CoA thioester hydrolase
MKFTTTLRVRYAETDQMGVVYHGNYFSWFEVGRVELLRTLGFSYQALEAEEGCMLPVVEASCRYRRPARYDDLLTLHTAVRALRGPIMICNYWLFRDDLLLAEAETKHVIVDRTMTRRKLPPRYHAAMLEVLEP